MSCNSPMYLRCICLKPDDPEKPPPLPDGKTIIFVTEGEHGGNFGDIDGAGGDGRTGANIFCRRKENIPDRLEQTKEFNADNIKAFISVKEGDAIEDMHTAVGSPFPADRPIYWWHPHLGPRLLANNWKYILNIPHVKNIRVPQNMGATDNRPVWTGSSGSGEALPSPLTCEEWATNDNTSFGMKGKADEIGNKWLVDSLTDSNKCDNKHPIRCIYFIPD